MKRGISPTDVPVSGALYAELGIWQGLQDVEAGGPVQRKPGSLLAGR